MSIDTIDKNIKEYGINVNVKELFIITEGLKVIVENLHNGIRPDIYFDKNDNTIWLKLPSSNVNINQSIESMIDDV